MGYQLGIDLGTTYSAAAVCRASDQRWVEPEMVKLSDRSIDVASVLFLAEDGSVLVGEAAERRAVTDPGRVVREFKRRLGDPTPLVVAGQSVPAEQLCARLVRWIVDRVAEREGGPADRIAVTHPASWGAHKKELLALALHEQGLTVTFLAEPQAAALHYAAAERVEPGSTIAVYDLGGGTFDAAVVRKQVPDGPAPSGGGRGAGFELLGRPEGLERLGGIDFDQAVFDHVLAGAPEIAEGVAELDDTDPALLAAVARLRRECTEAKEALSADTEVAIPVLLPSYRGSVRLHRTEFEDAIRGQLEDTVTALRSAVGSAGLAPADVTTILLVGGSSRIPLVAQLVSAELGRPVAVDTDPKNAIAKGAALAVSPKPTASWPSVAITPVPAAGAAFAEPLTSPAAPPFTPPGTPAVHETGGFGRPVPPRPPLSAAPVGEASAVGADGERTALLGPPATGDEAGALAGSGPKPVHGSFVTDWEHDTSVPRRRPVVLTVAAGGLVAAAAVVAAVLFWPSGAGTDAGSGVGITSPTAGTSEPTTPPPSQEQAEAPAPAPAQQGGTPAGTGGNGGTGNANRAVPTRAATGPAPAQGGAPQAPAPAPAAPPTQAPPPSSQAPAPEPSTVPTQPPAQNTPPPTQAPPTGGGGATQTAAQTSQVAEPPPPTATPASSSAV